MTSWKTTWRLAVLLWWLQALYAVPHVFQCDQVLPSGCICRDPDRPQVDCSYLQLTSIPQLTSNALQVDIHTLKLSHNNTTIIKKSDFTGYQNISIKRLIIDNNQIEEFEEDFLGGLKSTLERLNLSHNKLRYGSSGIALPGAEALRVLDLSYNKMLFSVKYILPNLEELYLEGNHLLDVEPYIFDKLPKLEVLSISFGDLGWRRYGGWNNPNLRSLSIVDSPDVAVKYDTIDALQEVPATLQSLAFIRCGINDSSDWFNFFPYDAPELTHVSLAGNDISHISGDIKYWLGRCSKLETLDLSNNKIENLTESQLLPFFGKFMNMTDLILRGNKLSYFEGGILALSHYMFQMRRIDLRDNYLTSIDLSYVLPYDFRVQLSGNPWRCDCNLLGMTEALHSQVEALEFHFDPSELYSTLTCRSPKEFQGELVLSVHDTLKSRCL